MTHDAETVPTGPEAIFPGGSGLLPWIERQFAVCDEIFQGTIFGTTAWVTRSPELAYHVLVENWRNYTKGLPNARVGMLLGNGLMSSEGDFWRQQRRMVQPLFHADCISATRGMIEAVTERVSASWQEAARRGEAVNVTQDVSAAALEIVLRYVFGADYAAVAEPFGMLHQEHGRNMDFARRFRSLGAQVRAVLAGRQRNAGARDGLSQLADARDGAGKPMPEPQLIDEVLTLVVAGHETTAATLSWAWYLLAEHPEVEARLAQELAAGGGQFLRQVLEEVLRLYPPGWIVYRRALAADRLGPYHVPAGMEVYVSPYFVQRHPRLWPRPGEFDPNRFSAENCLGRPRLAMMPFSAGPRNCIGERLARLEMEIHLATIVRRLRLLPVAGSPIELEAAVNLRPRHDLMLRPVVKSAAFGAMQAAAN